MKDKPLTSTILHIGSEKAGSSTIQSWLDGNREALRRSGIIFPKTPGILTHAALAAYALGEQDSRHLQSIYKINPSNFWTEFPRALLKEVRKSGATKVVLTNEHCSSFLRDKECVEKLIELLERFSSKITVIYYVRRQDEFWISKYSTDVIVGETQPLTFPEGDNLYLYDYYSVANLWSSVIGRSNFIVRRFGSGYFKNNNLISDFCDAAKIEEIPEIRVNQVCRANQRLSSQQVEYLRLFNHFVPSEIDGRLNPLRGRDIGAAVSRWDGEANPLSVPSEAVAKFSDQFSGPNELLRSQYAPNIPAPLFEFQCDSGDKHGMGELLTTRQAVEISARMWEHQKMAMNKRTVAGVFIRAFKSAGRRIGR